MNLRKNKGITMVALVITIIILLILAGISVTGVIRGIDETNESSAISQLEMVQHALLERKTKADLTKETLPGTTTDYTELQNLINEINTKSSANITLRGNKEDYKELSTSDLKELGIEKETNTFIVNYKTGEVINKTQKVTKAGRALYTYAK
ncbi:MAG: hypothetical protein BHW00_03795 [Clostridium sp. 26_22]|nr:MAG: hypothetical protein BHW00_03795 [Clostridium sp. 26_22]